MAEADAAAPAPEETGRTVGSGRQAAQGKKGYKDQRLPKTGKPSRRTSIEPGARCNRPWCLVLSWIATCCCAVRVHSKTIPLTAVQHRTACRSLELHPEPVLCERLSDVLCADLHVLTGAVACVPHVQARAQRCRQSRQQSLRRMPGSRPSQRREQIARLTGAWGAGAWTCQ